MYTLIVLTGKTLEERQCGINANVVIGHGISKRKPSMNMFANQGVVHANLAQKIKEANNYWKKYGQP